MCYRGSAFRVIPFSSSFFFGRLKNTKTEPTHDSCTFNMRSHPFSVFISFILKKISFILINVGEITMKLKGSGSTVVVLLLYELRRCNFSFGTETFASRRYVPRAGRLAR